MPKDLDLSFAIGEFTTQLRIGPFDLQFEFGDLHFAVWSGVSLHRDESIIAHWEPGSWPDAGFYDIMNTEVTRCDVVNDRLIVFEFANGIEMHLRDDSDQYESMCISVRGKSSSWVI